MNYKRIIKSRWFLGGLCILISIGLMLGYSSMINTSKQHIQIISVSKDIKKGDIIDSDHIDTVEVSSYNLSDDFIKTEADIVGKYADADFKSGDFVLKSKVSDTANETVNEKMTKLDGTKLSMSITLKTFASGLSDKLIAGDIVSCIVTNETQTAIPSELTYVEVLATTTIEGYDKSSPEDEGTGNLETATLLVTPQQAKLLASYEKNADLHLALAYRGEESAAKAFLDIQDKALTSNPQSNDNKEVTVDEQTNSTKGE